MSGLSRIKGLKLTQSISIFILLILLSGCITVGIIDGENNSNWLEVNKLPRATDVSPTISLSLPGATEVSPTISLALPGATELSPTFTPSPMIHSTPSHIIKIPQPAIKPDTWYFVAVTRQGRMITMYWDGRAVSFGEFDPLNLDAPISLLFGRQEGYQGMYLNGWIDEVEIYNGTALTQAQIFELYSAGSSGKCKSTTISTCVTPPAGLTGWWPGDGNTIDIATNRSGIYRDGAMTGPGLVDQAFALDGKDDFIEVPDDPALNFGSRDFTVDLWVNFKDLTGNQIFVEKWIQEDAQEHNISQGWSLGWVDNKIWFVMDDGSGTDYGLNMEFMVPTVTTTTGSISSTPASPTNLITQTSAPAESKLPGIIVFVCEIFLDRNTAQICMMNADGSNYRRLTTDDSIRYTDPRIDPEGKYIIFSALKTGRFQLFKMELDKPEDAQQLTFDNGDSTSPSISPDGKLIAYTFTQSDSKSIRIFDLQTSKSWQVYGPPVSNGWNPIWSFDGSQIMFLAQELNYVQLYVMNNDGLNYRQIEDPGMYHENIAWSPDGKQIAMAVGKAGERSIYVFQVDNAVMIPSLDDENEKIPSMSDDGSWIANNVYPDFSPDGKWIAYTAYTERFNNNSCEIFVYTQETGENFQLTHNIYCDYKPDWGP